jgi:hypothetical protein
MSPSFFAKVILGAFLMIIGLAAAVMADGLNNNEVDLTAKIDSFLGNGQGGGTLFVKVNETDLRVIVNDRTDILDKDALEGATALLVPGAAVRIQGKFSSSGILASEIQVLDKAADPNTFSVCGHITQVQDEGANKLVSLLGITVIVLGTTPTDLDGAEVDLASLQIGLDVCLDGEVSSSGNSWTATVVHIYTKEKQNDKRKGEVHFEGEVTRKVNDMTYEFTVLDTGVTGQVVLLDADTRVIGTLAVGVLADVKGVLNPGALSITARQIRVLEALEIKPDERKMKIGDTAGFTVKLREPAAVDVVEVKLILSVQDATVVSVSPTSIPIPIGSKTGEFTATALTLGSATITAEALGQQATAAIVVGTLSSDDTESPGKETHLAFAPSHIKMGTKDLREVVLLIQPPQDPLPDVSFTYDHKLLTVEPGKDLGGAAAYKVTIKSIDGATKGTSVKVQLTGVTDGPKAELVVEITDKGK